MRLSVINNNTECLGVGSIEAFVGLKTTMGVITRLTATGKSMYVQTKNGERLFRGMDHCPSVVEREATRTADARAKFTKYAK